MHIFYIDDSGDEELCVFSALALPMDQWRRAHMQIRDWRRSLRKNYGIYINEELHAWKFL
jgi:hypothetical protein